MFAGQSLNSGNRLAERDGLREEGIGCRHVEHGNLLASPRIVQTDMNLASAMLAGGQAEIQLGTVALLNAGEGLQPLRVLCQTAEAEVFEADDAAISDAGEVH